PPPANASLLHLAVVVALYAIAALIALQPVGEFDTWWHLRTGQWIVEHGSVPATDPFTSYGQGKERVAYSWLFGRLLFGLHSALGLPGIVLYRVVMAVAIIAALHRLVARREPRFAIVAVVVGAAAVALTPLLLEERPGLLTILFATLTLDAILTLREGRGNW